MLLRRLTPLLEPMKEEIKYSQILKRFDGVGPSHLELNLRHDPKLYLIPEDSEIIEEEEESDEMFPTE